MTDNILRWHTRLHARGYRASQPPETLLAIMIPTLQRDATTARAMLASSQLTILSDYQGDPDLVAHEISTCAHEHEHELSLGHAHNMLALETHILSFAAALHSSVALQRSLLLGSYLGRVVREFIASLRDPQPAGLAWLVHELAPGPDLVAACARGGAALETERWPDPEGCRQLARIIAALDTERPGCASSLHANALRIRRLLEILGAGGVTALFIHYMFAAIDRTELWCRARTPGRRGPMQQVCDDIATPILLGLGRATRSHQRRNRRPLHVARLDTITGRFWSRRCQGWERSIMLESQLDEFARLVHPLTSR